MDDQKDQNQKVLELVRKAVKCDEDLREVHQIGSKFRFVRDRLHSLLTQLEEEIKLNHVVKKDDDFQLAEDEQLVYVYLYNAHGINFNSWQNMVSPSVFYEYSVNRPIYAEKKDVENLLRLKKDKQQHAYLTIAVKKQNILSVPSLQDASGNPLIKVKEGSLKFERVMSFTHAQHEYTVAAEGELIKKESK